MSVSSVPHRLLLRLNHVGRPPHAPPSPAALAATPPFQDVPDKSLQAYALKLPDPSTLGEEMDVIEPDALYKALG